MRKKNEKKLLLHVGPHKTGTTAIQQSLNVCSRELKNHGWRFEKLDHLSGGTHRMADLISTNQWGEVLSYIRALSRCRENIVISSENFSRLNKKQASYLIENLKFDKIKVVYYIRNPLDRLESSWREQVKHGYRYTFLEFIAARLARPFNDRELNEVLKIEPWYEAVGAENLHLHLYDHLDGADSHFLEKYFPDSNFKSKTTKQVNASFSPEKTEVYRALSGAQTHLLKTKKYDHCIAKIIEKIGEIQLNSGLDYSRKFSLSMESPVMRHLEKIVIEKYKDCISYKITDGLLYEKRNVEWIYLAPEIWLENPDLAMKLFAFKELLIKNHGSPRFDLRLRAV